jgi:hypothetical protein
MAVDYNQALSAYQSLIPGADVSSPEGQDKFNTWWHSVEDLSPEVFSAALDVLAKPDQREAFNRDYGGNMKPWLDSVIGWWSANGHNVPDREKNYGAESKLIDAMGYQVNPAAVTATANANPLGTLNPNDTNATSLEQVIANHIVNYGNNDIAGDAARRAQAQSIADTTNRSIDDALRVNGELTGTTFDSQGYLRANPDVAAWAQKVVSEGQYPDLATAAKAHYDMFGRSEGRNAPTVTRLQLENQMADDTSGRLASAAQAAATTRLAALDQRKTEMTAALERMQGDRSGALDKETAQLREGLAQLETERTAALQQLNTARLSAAEGQVTGINQGLQSERDRLTAQNAEQGFIGGSSMQDAALARATIGARQGAAQAIGTAKVTNASDTRGLRDEIAGQRFGITGNDATTRYGIAEDANKGRFNLADSLSNSRLGVANTLASDTQGATDAGTKMRLGYFDNDFNRRLSSALLPIQLNSGRLSLVDAAGQIGQAGLTRTLNNLNWLAAPGTTPPTATPTTVTAPGTGADIAGLGAGLTRAGFNIGNSVGWGNLFPSRAGVGPATTYDDFIRNNPGSSAAGGGG